MAARALDWLQRPIAHRGLHVEAKGIVENSASAVKAAIAEGYAIEVDLQCAADGMPVVFHDATLDRLTQESGTVASRDAESLRAIALRGSGDRILSLPDLLALVAGRVPLLIEVKSTWGRYPRFAEAIAAALAPYPGKVAVMSFDPDLVADFRRLAPSLPRGLVSERFGDARYWDKLPKLRRFAMRHLLTARIAKPDFIAYDVRALPSIAPWIARNIFGLPLLTWTVRSEAAKEIARRHADAAIFEGVTP